MSYPHLYLYWVFAVNLLQHTLYRCRLSIDPFKVRADLGNLKPAANMRNHDFGNLVFEEGHQHQGQGYQLFFPIDYVRNNLK